MGLLGFSHHFRVHPHMLEESSFPLLGIRFETPTADQWPPRARASYLAEYYDRSEPKTTQVCFHSHPRTFLG